MDKDGVMKGKIALENLHPRERQIVEIIYRYGNVTAKEVQERLPDPVSNPAVRKMLGNLESKGLIKHEVKKGKFIYSAVVPKEKARKRVLDHLLEVFFDNEEESAILAVIKKSEIDLSKEEIDQICEMIRRAKREGR